LFSPAFLATAAAVCVFAGGVVSADLGVEVFWTGAVSDQLLTTDLKQ
jgi:hypothetical protein